MRRGLMRSAVSASPLQSSSGSRVPVLVGGASFEAGGNEGVAFVLDLSEQKRSEERYRIVVETASDAVITADESGLILFTNPATKRIFGYDSTELIGRPLTTLMPEFMRKLHEAGFKRYLATGQRHINWQGTELIGMRKNGEEFPLEISFGEQIRNGHRVFTGFVRDISEKKKAEEALRRSEAHLSQAQRLAHVGSWVWQVAGRKPVYLSEEWYRVHGFDPKVGMPTWEERLQRVHPEDRAKWQAAIDRAIDEKSDYDLEFRILPPDTAVRYIHSVGHPVFGSSGELVQFVGVSMDVTESKQAEQAFRLLVLGTAATTGRDFFQSLVQHMAQALRARYAFVTTCDDQKHARTLAFWKGDGFGEDFDFDIVDTPCEKVLHGEVCHYRQGLQGLFPLDKILADWQAESYLGVPMLDRSNRVIGHIAILDDKPMEADLRAIDLLKMFASRAAAELKRQKAEDELQAALQERERMRKELRDVIETIPTSAWTTMADGSVEFVNRRWREYTGLSGEGSSGSGWQAAVHPEDIGRHVDKWRTSLATGELFENEVRYRCSADGKYRWFLARAVPLRDEQGNILKWYGISTDIEERRRAEGLLAGEKRILEMVARGDSLAQILDSLCLLVEEQDQDVLASILLVEGNRLRHGGAPSLPKAYRDSTDGIVIGPRSGSCATAAFPGEQVIVSDIATDPLWADYRDAALQHSLRTCWSTPVFSSEGKVIATLAMYYREPRSPSPRDKEIVEQISHLAGVAIQRKMAEEKLRLSEAYSAEAQSLSHTGSWHWNVSTGEVAWSQAYCAIFGFDFETDQPSYQLFIERVHPEDRPKVEQVLWADVREKRDFDGEYRLLLPDGSIKYLHSLGKCSLDQSGDVEYIGAVVDITEHKRAEQELRDSEERHRVVVEAASDAVISMDENGDILLANAAALRVFGYDPTELIGKPLTLLMPKYMRTLHEKGFKSYLATGERHINWQGAELTGLRKNGQEFPVEISFGELVKDGRRIFTGFIRDISERKRAEEALRRSESYLAEAQRLTHIGSWAGNILTREIFHSSDEHSRLYGLDPESGIPSFEALYQRVHPQDQVGLVKAFERASHDRIDVNVQYRIVVPDGTTKHVEAVGHPVLKPSGEAGEFIGFLMDVTERKRAEEERERLRQAQADLAHINRVSTMGELTASLAHEIKQPIAAATTDAKTCLRWLGRDEPDVGEAREAASRLIKDVSRASDIIGRIGMLFRKNVPKRELVDVNDVIQEMIVLLRGEAVRYSISIHGDLASDLPKTMADRVQLQQVLMNLMLNGIEAMKDMGTTGELTIKSEQDENRRIIVAIADTGVGLRPDQTEQVFDAFFTSKPQGTGMGLSISRSIVESHGGRLWASPNSGTGATFQFTLPIEVAAHEAA